MVVVLVVESRSVYAHPSICTTSLFETNVDVWVVQRIEQAEELHGCKRASDVDERVIARMRN